MLEELRKDLSAIAGTITAGLMFRNITGHRRGPNYEREPSLILGTQPFHITNMITQGDLLNAVRGQPGGLNPGEMPPAFYEP